MANVEVFALVASVIAGFGTTILVLGIRKEPVDREPGPVPWADRLLILAVLDALLLVLLPLVVATNRPGRMADLPAAACAAAIALAAGYLLATLARYGRFPGGKGAEKWLAIAALLAAIALFVCALIRYPAPVQL